MATDLKTICDAPPLAYQLDDFIDGWRDAPYVMLLHGIAESGRAYARWVPHLAGQYRVLRPDLRGHGKSAAVAHGDTLSVAQLADDIEQLIAHLGVSQLHVVGAKLGAQVALELAQRQVPWMSTLSLAGVLISPSGALAKWLPQWNQLVDEGGVQAWARATMPGRMGSALSDEGNEWWIRYMGQTSADTARACFRLIQASAEPTRLEQIACPTQIIAPIRPAQAATFSQQPSLDEVRRWAARIPQGRVVGVEADSYHIAATHPDACAAMTTAFIEEQTL